jgi:hypothetical protein
MTSFSTAVQSASLVALVSLLVYTLWLMRSGGLSAHVTVRWVLAEGAAILALVLWSWLPFFSITSGLNDRELLVILAVVLFVLIAFLMLDSLARISTHTHQIKRLTQEIALLRVASQGVADTPAPAAPVVSVEAALAQPKGTDPGDRHLPTWPKMLAIIWIGSCVAFFVLEMRSDLFLFLKANLTAAYLQ